MKIGQKETTRQKQFGCFFQGGVLLLQ